MDLTLFGYVFLPLCGLAMWHTTRLLQLVLIAGVFGAASPLVISGFGLPPGVAPAALFMGFVVMQYLLGARFRAAAQAWHLLEPFVITSVYALLTGLLIPRLFAGEFSVWPQKLAPPFGIPTLLGPSASNVTQGFYLLTEASLVVAASLYLSRSRLDLHRLLQAYLVSGYLVAGFCFWQLAHKMTGIYYPDAILYSNPGWAILPGQMLGFVPRINGPFSEPAGLAYYLSGTIFCCTWLVLRGYRNRMATALLPMAVASLLLSTSTTGFAVLGIGVAGIAAYGCTRAPRRIATRIFLIATPAALLVIAAGFGIASVSDQIEATINLILRANLNKSEGESYINRTSLDIDSLAVLVPSYGLGAGWGSVRSSSLIPGLLANLGLAGFGMLLWFVLRLVRSVGRARRQVEGLDQLMVIDGMAAALVGHLTAAMVSAPALNAVDFYLLLAVLIASTARVQHDATQRGRRPAAARQPVLGPVQPA